jgi:hypothetical protein
MSEPGPSVDDARGERERGSRNENENESESERERERRRGRGTAADVTADPAVLRRRVQRAVQAVRREGQKAALIYAVVDGALAATLAAAAVRLVGTGSLPLPELVSLPPGVAGVAGVSTVATASLVSLAAGLVVAAAEFGYRATRPLVERFESVNPRVSESLRTARDAAADGRDSRMALRLYRDVLAGLRETSSLGLVDTRRVAATVLLVAVVGFAGVHLAVADIQVSSGERNGGGGGGGGGAGAGTAGTGGEADYGGLREGSEILGDAEDVQSGRDALNASVERDRAGGEGDTPPPDSYDDGGLSGGGGGVESQRAGFSPEPVPEDADLVREYTVRIRQPADEGESE